MGGRRERRARHQSVEYGGRRRRVRAGRSPAGHGRDRSRTRRVRQVVDEQHPAARGHSRRDRLRNPGAQGRTGNAAFPRRRQDAAGRHRRGDARGQHFQVLRGRGTATARRARAVRASGHRSRDHARTGGRGRHDHAVEFSARDSGLEDRAGARVRQLRGLQAGRARSGLRVGDRGDRFPHRAAAGSVQSGHGARISGRRRVRDITGRGRDHVHRIGAHGQGDCPDRPSNR